MTASPPPRGTEATCSTKSGWYSIQLKIACDRPGCHSRATRQIFNRYNASCGIFCQRHASEKIRESERPA